MHIQLVAKPSNAMTGTSRYTYELHQGLRRRGVDATLLEPAFPRWLVPAAGVMKRFGMDLRTFFTSYPLYVPQPRHKGQRNARIVHLPTQTMATVLAFQRFKYPVVITVLDIIPFLVKDDPVLNTLRHPADRQLYRLALHGLHQAKALIAISHYTKQTLIDRLNIPSERIHVTHLGVDLQRFRPLEVTTTFRQQYGLSADHRHLIYVGSEDPRKNLQALVRAMAHLRDEFPDVRLVKVGKAHFDDERQRLLSLIDELGLREQVILLDDVSDDDLPMVYSAAALVVMPSLYEGFGFPVIEANACGTPVLAANATSLPELVADQSVLFDPRDPLAIASAIRQALARQAVKGKESEVWQRHAAQFTWERTVDQTLRVYQMVTGR